MKKIVLLSITLLIILGCDLGRQKAMNGLVVQAFNYGYVCSGSEMSYGECLGKLREILNP